MLKIIIQTEGGNLVELHDNEETANDAKREGKLALGPAEAKALSDVRCIFPDAKVVGMMNLRKADG